MIHKTLFALFFLFSFYFNTSLALQYPRPLSNEPRIKVINYDPNAIHLYVGHYGYQSSILFENDETIQTISMGDSTAWQLVPQGSRLMLKPIEQDADTNVTVITDKRVYHFEFIAREAASINDPELAYEVRFVYPATSSGGFKMFTNNESGGVGVYDYTDIEIPDITEPNNFNFLYTLSGSYVIAPVLVFDDNNFTYIQFDENNKDLPAIFSVDHEGHESLVNFKSSQNFIVIEKVWPVFTLRYGNEIACLFNEKIPFYKKDIRKRKTGIFGKR